MSCVTQRECGGDHINYISNKAYSRSFFLRRLKDNGASQKALKEIYILYIRSILEISAPLWTGALTKNKKLTNKLEKVQRFCCRIIRPDLSYTMAKLKLGLKSLSEHRLKISVRCAKKMSKNPKFTKYFPTKTRTSARKPQKYIEPKWKHNRYGFSTLPFFIRLLNKNSDKS